jgi:citrate lyase beta subunit
VFTTSTNIHRAVLAAAAPSGRVPARPPLLLEPRLHRSELAVPASNTRMLEKAPGHYAMARIAVTCRAHGLRPIDGPFGDFADPEGYGASARRALALGYEGKWAIHPSQIPLANEVFTPDPRSVEQADRIIAAMKDGAADGMGAVSVDGRLVDAASVRMAENLLAKRDQITANRRRSPAAPGPEALAA